MNNKLLRTKILAASVIAFVLFTSCVKEPEFENCLMGTSIEFADLCGGENELTYRLWDYGTPTTIKKLSTIQRFFKMDSVNVIVTLYFNKRDYNLTEDILREHFPTPELFNNQDVSFSITVKCNGQTYTNLMVKDWIKYDYEIISNLRMTDVRYNSNGNCSSQQRLSSISTILQGNLKSEAGKLLNLDGLELQMQLKHN